MCILVEFVWDNCQSLKSSPVLYSTILKLLYIDVFVHLLFLRKNCDEFMYNIPKRQKEEWKVGGRQVDICVHVGKGGGRVVGGVSGRVVGGVSHLWWGVLPAVQEQVTLTQLSTRGPEMETREGSSQALKAPLSKSIGQLWT